MRLDAGEMTIYSKYFLVLAQVRPRVVDVTPGIYFGRTKLVNYDGLCIVTKFIA